MAVGMLAAVLAQPAGVAARMPCWTPPVSGTIVDEFRPPACPWCPGNRGLEYRTRPGSAVRAVESGTVTFSGVVAGTRYVVVAGAGDRLVTYGRLAASPIRHGAPVVRGALVGRSGTGFYFGVRLHGEYIDPAPMLGELVGRRRLIPIDGAAPRPAPPATLRCGPPTRIPR